MTSTLRTYLGELGNNINKIEKEVDPYTQVGDLCSQSKRTIFFQNIKGFSGWKICDLLVRDRNLQAKALGTSSEKVVATLANKFSIGKGKTNLVKSGPVKEKIMKGNKADLSKIPFCIHTPRDGGPYIGSGMCLIKDPDTGVQNVAMHRMHIKNKGHTAFSLFSPHNRAIFSKYQSLQKTMPMAVVIGHHPCYEIASCYSGDHVGYSEHEMVGSLLDETINLVKCETLDLEVPADAEIILEGEVLPDVLDEEGPFGEFHLYYATGITKRPVWRVNAITMRKDAIFRHLNATPYTDHQALIGLAAEAQLYNQLNRSYKVHDIYVPPWGGLFLAVIKITPQTEQQVRDLLLTTLFSPAFLFSKIAIAVDEDIDIYDAQDLFYAFTTRVNPSADIIKIKGTSGLPLDLSTKQISPGEVFRLGGKLGIDATKPPIIRKDQRDKFERISPKGWGGTFIDDFLSNI